MSPRKSNFVTEIVILAGGLSSRMGRDKSRIRLGRRTILGHVRAIAAQLHLPVRVLRRDALPRCGPLGGIYTALTRSRADAVLFLACDMPFVSPAFLKQMLKIFRSSIRTEKHKSRTSSPPLLGERAGVRASSSLSNLFSKKMKLAMSALFASHNQLFGLPCLLHRETALSIVSRQIAQKQFSLQSLARALKAKTLRPARNPAHQLLNLNTPADLETARRKLRSPQIKL